jgi:hypothetical protein
MNPFFQFKAEYDLSDFNVVYKIFLLRSPMLNFCITNLVYLVCLIILGAVRKAFTGI